MDRAGQTETGDRARLVGRDAELDVLLAAQRQASAGQPNVVMVDGEGGIGKSALLREFAAHAADAGAAVLRASGAEAEQLLDYGVVEQLYDAAAAQGHEVVVPFGRFDARPDPFAVGNAVVLGLSALDETCPAVLVVDDAQWADPPSVQSLTFALRRLRFQRVLTVVAHRPGAPGLGSLLRLCRDGRGQRLALGGLRTSDILALAAQHDVSLSLPAAERLREHTHGNPFAVSALLDELDADTLNRGFGPLPAPHSLATLVLNRLADCSPAVEQLVATIAVLGQPCDLHRLSEFDAPALDEAVRRRLLAVERRAGRIVVDVFHPLVRAAVEHDLGPGRAAELHAKAADLAHDEVRRTLHLVRAARTVDEGLGRRAVALADEQLASGWDFAGVELLLAAAQVFPDGGERTEALLTAAGRLIGAGERVAARHVLSRVPEGGGPLALLVRGHQALLDGDSRRAKELLTSAWHADPSPVVGARAAGLLATVASNAGDAPAAIRWARHALEGGRDGANDLAHAMTMLASAYALDGDLRSGLAEVERWLAVVSGEPAASDGRVARGLLLVWSGAVADGAALLASVVAVEHHLPLLTRATAGYALADARYRMGHWDGALRSALRVIAELESADQPLALPMAYSVAAAVLSGRGDPEAGAHLAAGRDALARTGARSGLLWTSVAEARRAAAVDDHGGVVAALEPLRGLLAGTRLPDGVMPFRGLLGEAYVHLGRLHEAADVLVELEERGGGHPSARAAAERVRGLLAAAGGDHSGAQAVFAAAIDAAPPTLPFDRAALLLAAGACARRGGRRREAADHLRGACAAFAALGAEPYRRRAQAELDACGLAPRRGGLGDQLTPAECNVAELVAQGLTNRQIAAKLVVSLKTVETHLSRIFTRWGVRSRTEVALRWRDGAP